MNLSTIVIPKSISKIYASAFSGCNGIKNVYYTGTNKQWKSIEVEKDNEYLKKAKIYYNHKHTIKTKTTKATKVKDGKSVTACTVCNTVTKTVTIPKISTIKLSEVKYKYNGKVKTPAVTVKDRKGKTLKNGTDYSVKYSSGRKKPGKYTVTVTFSGIYSGTEKLNFTIVSA